MASRKTSSVTPGEDSRLSRIRENQRRSRARKREYLEDLEGCWKRSQELGVQANVELQKAAQKVIEENIILRKILAELGLGTAHIDKRLQELKDTTITDSNDYSISSGHSGCAAKTTESNPDGAAWDTAASLDSPQLSQQPFEPAGASKRLNTCTFGDGSAKYDVNPSIADVDGPSSTLHNPTFDILETVPDFEPPFDLAGFLESFGLTPSPSCNSFGPIDQQVSSSLDSLTAAPDSSTPSPATPPQNLCSTSCAPTTTTKSTTPCIEAYALLKILNAQRQEHKDMFQIVLELWDGFCCPGPGDDGEKGCRVDNAILQKVIDRLK